MDRIHTTWNVQDVEDQLKNDVEGANMKKIKFISVAIILVLACVMFAGCGLLDSIFGTSNSNNNYPNGDSSQPEYDHVTNGGGQQVVSPTYRTVSTENYDFEQYSTWPSAWDKTAGGNVTFLVDDSNARSGTNMFKISTENSGVFYKHGSVNQGQRIDFSCYVSTRSLYVCTVAIKYSTDNGATWIAKETKKIDGDWTKISASFNFDQSIGNLMIGVFKLTSGSVITVVDDVNITVLEVE